MTDRSEATVDFAAIRLFHTIVDQAAFQKLVASLSLKESQQAPASELFSVYSEGVSGVSARTMQRVRKAGLDDIIAADRDIEALGGGDRAARLNHAMQMAVASGRAETDRLLQTFFDGLRALLSPPQQARFTVAERTWRRGTLLNVDGRGSARLDLHRHPDLIELVHTACEAGGEMRALGADLPQGLPLTHRLAVGAERLREAVEAYEASIDALLVAEFQKALDAKQRLREASMKRDTKAAQAAFTSVASSWRRLHEVGVQATKVIADIVREAIGEEAAALWLDRANEAHYPATFAVVTTELAHDWLEKQDDLSESQRLEIQQAWLGYVRQRKELREKSMRDALEARLTQSLYLGNFDPSHPGENRAGLESHWRTLVETTNRRFRSTLSFDQAAQYDRELERVRTIPIKGMPLRF